MNLDYVKFFRSEYSNDYVTSKLNWKMVYWFLTLRLLTINVQSSVSDIQLPSLYCYV